MTLVLVLLMAAVLALGLAVSALVLRTGAPGVPDPVTTESFEPLPRGMVAPEQLTELQFDQALRGYRMSQVDQVLDQLAEELRDRDAEVARLRAELAAVPVDYTGRAGVVDDPVADDRDDAPADPQPQQQAGDRGDL